MGLSDRVGAGVSGRDHRSELRGLRKSGSVMAVPVYAFLACYLGMLAVGAVRALLGNPGSFEAAAPPATKPLTAFLVLHALASGCTALTGIEAISNGVPVFKAPEVRNATRTLVVMAILMGILFLGSVGLTQYFGIVAQSDETILSALARHVLGDNVLFVIVQATTLLILVVAANTSFAGFPRLASVLAQDGFAPHQLSLLGDRLVYSNGMLLLAGFGGRADRRVQGQFACPDPALCGWRFPGLHPSSQAGMVVHWLGERRRGWKLKALINGVGAVATADELTDRGHQ